MVPYTNTACKRRMLQPLLRISGKFDHTFANSGNPDETAFYEPSHQDYHYLLSLFIFIPNN